MNKPPTYFSRWRSYPKSCAGHTAQGFGIGLMALSPLILAALWPLTAVATVLVAGVFLLSVRQRRAQGDQSPQNRQHRLGLRRPVRWHLAGGRRLCRCHRPAGGAAMTDAAGQHIRDAFEYQMALETRRRLYAHAGRRRRQSAAGQRPGADPRAHRPGRCRHRRLRTRGGMTMEWIIIGGGVAAIIVVFACLAWIFDPDSHFPADDLEMR